MMSHSEVAQFIGRLIASSCLPVMKHDVSHRMVIVKFRICIFYGSSSTHPILVKTDNGRCSYISVCVRDGAGETASNVTDFKRRALNNLEIIDCLFAYVIPIECTSVAMLQRFSGNYSPV
jgi:hypothetical protein